MLHTFLAVLFNLLQIIFALFLTTFLFINIYILTLLSSTLLILLFFNDLPRTYLICKLSELSSILPPLIVAPIRIMTTLDSIQHQFLFDLTLCIFEVGNY